MKAVFFLPITLLLVFSSACKKNKEDNEPDSNTPAVNKRDVKYELTGNYAGMLEVTYTNAGGTLTTVEIPSLPWSINVMCESSVYSVGIGGSSESLSENLGVEGQTVTMKIYSAGSAVKTQTSTADESGYIHMPAIAYSVY